MAGARTSPSGTRTSLQSLNVLSAQPHVIDQQVSDIPAYKWTASEMMGICSSDPAPAQGVENGLACDRSTDVWGIALDRQCRLSVTWPVAPDGKGGSTVGVPGHAPGTYVSTQSDTAGLCPSGNPPAAAAFLPANAAASCGDRIAPASRVTGRVTASRRRLRFAGRATDTGCGHRVNTVRVSVSRRLAHQKCRFLLGNKRFSAPRSCKRTTYLPATGRTSFAFARKLQAGQGPLRDLDPRHRRGGQRGAQDADAEPAAVHGPLSVHGRVLAQRA